MATLALVFAAMNGWWDDALRDLGNVIERAASLCNSG